ncbi:TPA: hypothetical protein VB895_000815 [Streptococcus suis]|nr:hypothetical protein [Streptococcus suis]HEP1828067.1 hypothetical protein [Streptococcus suis]
MTDYYKLENMLVAGFKSQDEFERYQELKQNYEDETMDYSFSIREIVSQLEVIIETKENDFPDLELGLLHDYQALVERLRKHDVVQAEFYRKKVQHG